ncbi:phosphatase PAP2 family protein [Lutibaculum baratangense]|nr:phosphatase PAP2 family protein [Lutibaculum baratangense]
MTATRAAHMPPLARLSRLVSSVPRFLLVAALVGASAVFIASPEIDISVSRHFFDGEGFPATGDAVLRLIRSAGIHLTAFIIVASLAAVAFAAVSGRMTSPRPSRALFVLSVYLAGPGLAVNAILKEVWGRARPRELIEFGGDGVFSPVWIVAGSCVGNCSFSSGEAASAAALLSLLVLVPKSDRKTLGLGLFTVALVLSVNRIAFGGHFLSDVVVSWLLVLLIAVCLFPLFSGARGEAIDRVVLGSRARAAAWWRGVRWAAAAGRLRRRSG